MDGSNAGSGKETAKDVLEDFQCPICRDILSDPAVLPCSHMFCQQVGKAFAHLRHELGHDARCQICSDCVKQYLRMNKDGQNCPMCKTPCRPREIRKLPMMVSFLRKWATRLGSQEDDDDDLHSLMKKAAKLQEAGPRGLKRVAPENSAQVRVKTGIGEPAASSEAVRSPPPSVSVKAKSPRSVLQAARQATLQAKSSNISDARASKRRKISSAVDPADSASGPGLGDSPRTEQRRRRTSRLEDLARRRKDEQELAAEREREEEEASLKLILAQSRREAIAQGIDVDDSVSEGGGYQKGRDSAGDGEAGTMGTGRLKNLTGRSSQLSSLSRNAENPGAGTHLPLLATLGRSKASSQQEATGVPTLGDSDSDSDSSSASSTATASTGTNQRAQRASASSIHGKRSALREQMSRGQSKLAAATTGTHTAADQKGEGTRVSKAGKTSESSSSSDSDSDTMRLSHTAARIARAKTQAKARSRARANKSTGTAARPGSRSSNGVNGSRVSRHRERKAMSSGKSRHRSSNSDSNYSGEDESTSNSDIEIVKGVPQEKGAAHGKTSSAKLSPQAASTGGNGRGSKVASQWARQHQALLAMSGNAVPKRPPSQFLSYARLKDEDSEGKSRNELLLEYFERIEQSIGSPQLLRSIENWSVLKGGAAESGSASGSPTSAQASGGGERDRNWMVQRVAGAVRPAIPSRQEDRAVHVMKRETNPLAPPSIRLPIVMTFTSGQDAMVTDELNAQINELIANDQLGEGARIESNFIPGVTTHVICASTSSRDSKITVQLALEDKAASDDESTSATEDFTVTASIKHGCRRTTKLLRGVAEGCWIVDHSWLSRMSNTQRWVAEEEFEVDADVDGYLVAQASRVSRMRTQRGLLHGWVFAVSENTESQVSQSALTHILESAGATVIHLSHMKTHDGLMRTARTYRNWLMREGTASSGKGDRGGGDAQVSEPAADEVLRESVQRHSEQLVVTESVGPISVLAITGENDQSAAAVAGSGSRDGRPVSQACTVPILSTTATRIKLSKCAPVPASSRRPVGAALHPRDVLDYGLSCEAFIARGRLPKQAPATAGAPSSGEADVGDGSDGSGGSGSGRAQGLAPPQEKVFKYGQRAGMAPVSAAVQPILEPLLSKNRRFSSEPGQPGRRPMHQPKSKQQTPQESFCDSESRPGTADLARRLGCVSLSEQPDSPASCQATLSQLLQSGMNVFGGGLHGAGAARTPTGQPRARGAGKQILPGAPRSSTLGRTSPSVPRGRVLGGASSSGSESGVLMPSTGREVTQLVKEWGAQTQFKRISSLAIKPGGLAAQAVQLVHLQRLRWELDVMRRQLLTDCIVLQSVRRLPAYGGGDPSSPVKRRRKGTAAPHNPMDRMLDIGMAYMRPVVDARWLFACMSQNQLVPMREYLLFAGFGGYVDEPEAGSIEVAAALRASERQSSPRHDSDAGDDQEDDESI